MSPSEWGPPIWTFFHVLAEKIGEDQFSSISNALFMFTRRIMSMLPCPDCANHATQFLSKVNFANIKTRSDFANILCIFHNVVNRRKAKPLFDRSELSSIYANKNLIEAYNNFVGVFNSGRNFKLLADSMQRKLVVRDFRTWFTSQLGSTIFLNIRPPQPS